VRCAFSQFLARPPAMTPHAMTATKTTLADAAPFSSHSNWLHLKMHTCLFFLSLFFFFYYTPA
jgi:hypothetical protein